MSHFYTTLCRLGPQLIDDSKRHIDRFEPEENALALRHHIGAQSMSGTVRQIIRYGCTTDDFWTHNIEEVLEEELRRGSPTRKAAYAAADMWIQEIGDYLYNEGRYSIRGWRLKKSDRKLMNQLVEAAERVKAELDAASRGAEASGGSGTPPA